MKDCLELPVGQRMTGEDLCSEYNSSLDNRMKTGIPALSVIYEVSSMNKELLTWGCWRTPIARRKALPFTVA